MTRNRFVEVVAVSALLVLASGTPLSAQESKTPTPSPLIVHEWGTFTSFAGSDGVNLEFRPLADSDLPGFVYSPSSLNLLTKRTLFARQRMETPVTYFYSDVERDVNVAVAFRQGKLTEFYPPPLTHTSTLAADQKTLVEERIDWGKVHIIPERLLATRITNPEVAGQVNRHVAMGLVPWFDELNPYYQARKTDSALLFVHRRQGEGQFPMASTDFRGDHFEKFLFYRGAGQIDLPLKAVAFDGNRVHLRNQSQEQIRGGLVVHYDGEQLRFKAVRPVAPGEEMEVTLPAPQTAAQPDQLKALDEQFISQLTAEGLYEKESISMVNTWRQSWYREIGLRVFFFVPQSQTDEILPLTIEPKPEKVVRVLVARTELMTPAEERDILALLEQSTEDSQALEKLVKELAPRGRLAEAALKRCAAFSKRKNLQEVIDRAMPHLSAAGG
jgi:hypothetical protein